MSDQWPAEEEQTGFGQARKCARCASRARCCPTVGLSLARLIEWWSGADASGSAKGDADLGQPQQATCSCRPAQARVDGPDDASIAPKDGQSTFVLLFVSDRTSERRIFETGKVAEGGFQGLLQGLLLHGKRRSFSTSPEYEYEVPTYLVTSYLICATQLACFCNVQRPGPGCPALTALDSRLSRTPREWRLVARRACKIHRMMHLPWRIGRLVFDHQGDVYSKPPSVRTADHESIYAAKHARLSMRPWRFNMKDSLSSRAVDGCLGENLTRYYPFTG